MTALDPLAYVPRGAREPGQPPAVGLVGYYGHGNYGDELFLEVFREHLEPALALDVVLDSPGHASIRRRLGSTIRDSDAILIGGGDLVISWPTWTRYWDRTYLRRPVFIAGIGVPTWRKPDDDSVRQLRRFFQHSSVQLIGARDPESSAWITDHLEPFAPVVTAPDLVCGLTMPTVERPADPPIFGVAVRGRSHLDDMSHVRRMCERAAEMGYRVRRIVLATGQTRENDLVATRELGLPQTELVASDDLDTISRAIGECTLMASMKFHGVVVATMYGVPCIVLMPTAKNRNFIRAIGRPDLLSAFSNPELPDLVTRDMPPVSADVRRQLRHDVTAHLADLRGRIETAS
jgi:polysaccharide pyruvyl transferase WcaK-like protein